MTVWTMRLSSGIKDRKRLRDQASFQVSISPRCVNSGMRVIVRWLVRLILLLLAYFTALHAYESSIQVIDSMSFVGSDGQLRTISCRPFDYDPCMKFSGELSKGYSALAG